MGNFPQLRCSDHGQVLGGGYDHGCLQGSSHGGGVDGVDIHAAQPLGQPHGLAAPAFGEWGVQRIAISGGGTIVRLRVADEDDFGCLAGLQAK